MNLDQILEFMHERFAPSGTSLGWFDSKMKKYLEDIECDETQFSKGLFTAFINTMHMRGRDEKRDKHWQDLLQDFATYLNQTFEAKTQSKITFVEGEISNAPRVSAVNIPRGTDLNWYCNAWREHKFANEDHWPSSLSKGERFKNTILITSHEYQLMFFRLGKRDKLIARLYCPEQSDEEMHHYEIPAANLVTAGSHKDCVFQQMINEYFYQYVCKLAEEGVKFVEVDQDIDAELAEMFDEEEAPAADLRKQFSKFGKYA